MFVVEIPNHHREYFGRMVELQQLVIDAMGPSVEASAVDQAVHEYCKE